MVTKSLLQAIAVTAELTGTSLSETAARVFAEDLSRYPLEQVLSALDRCRREIRNRLTLADVISRLDDGRPGAEEAWSQIPKGEDASIVWSEEMRQAWGIALPMIEADDLVAARMAFLESYRALVADARDKGVPVKWTFSPGMDKAGRELALLDAGEKGRLSVDAIKLLLPYHRTDEGLNARLLSLARSVVKRIEDKEPA